MRHVESLIADYDSPTEYLEAQAPSCYGLWRVAAERGDAGAQFLVGLCLGFGAGVIENEREGYEWLCKAANQSHICSEFVLGRQQLMGGGGHEAEGIQTLKDVANRGFAAAQYELGRAYEQGVGVQRGAREAIGWYTMAGESGLKVAQVRLAKAYARGDIVFKDDYQCFRWTLKIAEGGEAVAQYSVGVMYLDGTGVDKDLETAITWFDKVIVNFSAGNDLMQQAMQARLSAGMMI